MKDSTLVTHPPKVQLAPDNRPLVAPIYQSVKFTFDSVDEIERKLRGERAGFWYSRQTNPTLRQLELTLAQMQGREECLLTASGVAAANLAMLALCKQNDHVICFAEMYGPTRHMVRRVLGRYGVKHTVLSIEDLTALEQTLASTPTRLIVFESPTNPALKIADIERIAALAKQHGALTLLDNTLAGLHNHGQYPIDIFVHSLTKYVSGHGDVFGGAIIGDRSRMTAMRPELGILGAVLDPHAAFLLQRGLKTYFLRYERQCSNALAVAEYLATLPHVTNVRYPGLKADSGHLLAARQQRDFGTMITCEVGSKEEAVQFAERLKLFAISVSLGSVESLVLPPPLVESRDLKGEEREWSGVNERTLRLSVGIEEVSDLIADLELALAKR
ncbi:MAG TPA: aminotransferase class I/II-fold pyridoxal phosphate-dependent enzyme [Steroidobacteraceae bacterium]|nr:aminotransferase class I/II-fold pyridoxal phosphate-dependent enzyme [Steroidobacteraceae bacterium]